MRAVLGALGAFEVVSPILALGLALQRRAHEVVLALSPEHTGRAEQLRLPAISVPDFSPLNSATGIGYARSSVESAATVLSEMYRKLIDVCHNADVLVAMPDHPVYRMTHETLSIPYVAMRVVGQQASDNGLDGQLNASMLNEFRKQAGLPLLNDPSIATRSSRHLALLIASRFLLPGPDEECFSKTVGFFDLEDEIDQCGIGQCEIDQRDVALEEFFAAGKPPVVVMVQDQEECDAMIPLLHKLLNQNCRAIFQLPDASWLGSGATQLQFFSNHRPGKGLPESPCGAICFTSFVPRNLLRRAAIILHHGGPGASVSAFRAGVPAIIMPRTAEQFVWAELAKSKGCIRNILPHEHVTADRLSAAIQGTLASPQYGASASTLAAQMESEGGVATAAELIEEFISSLTTASGSGPAMLDYREAPPLARVERGNDFPLSFAQQRLWFLDQLLPGTRDYNMPLSLRLTGTLNVQALCRSLADLVKRHESLRTTFVSSAEGPVQKIAPVLEVELERVDLSGLSHQQGEAEALRLARAEAEQPFDLFRGPLLRTNLLKLDERHHVLLLTVHHIVCDGWSVSILTRELSVMYEAYVNGDPARLLELSVQYVDFTLWQRKWLQGPALETQLEYWRRQLQGVATLDLPTDYPRKADVSYRGARVELQLESGLLLQLRKVCRQEQTTLFAVLLAAFQLLLAKYSGEQDVAVGTAIANRTCKELEGVVGFFVNTLVMRTRLGGNPSLLEALRRTRQVAMEAYRNQDVPFEKLAQELQPARTQGHSPFFQTMLVLENLEKSSFKLHGMEVTSFGPAHDSAKFDLTLALRERQGAMAGEIVYASELYDSETIQRMAGHWRRILEEMVRRPDLKIDELSLLEESERRQLLQLNCTAREFSRRCVHELIEEQVVRSPDAPALEFEGHTMTYRDLNRFANGLSRYLQAYGVRLEDKVAIFLDRGPEMLVAILAVWKAGAAYVPLDPSYPVERLGYMLEDSRARVMISQQQLSERLDHGTHVIDIARHWGEIKTLGLEEHSSTVYPANLAYMIYTSGSTGRPKGTEISHRALVNFLTAMQRSLDVRPCDVYLAETPLSFDIAGLELYLPLCAGARVKLVNRTESIDAFQLARRISEDATFVQATPATWQMVLDSGWKNTRELKILCGGEALTVELARRLMEQSSQVWNMYGPTETTVWSLMQPLRPDDDRVLIGRPIANTEIYVLDENMLCQPVGIAGELYIAGAGLARGYWRRSDLTAEKFVPDPFSNSGGERMYRTGDRVRWRLGGSLEFLGRIDDQVKVRGHRIELGEIESVLGECPLVRQAAVVCREYQPGEKRVVAYVVAHDGMEPSTPELMKFARKSLLEHMIPSATVWLDELPMTPNRKIDRKSLPKPQPVSESSYTAPRSREEEILQSVWSELLKRERIGVTENFFELGGHSLLAVQLVTRLRALYQVELPLRVIFDCPTIAESAVWLTNAKSADAKSPPLVRVRRKAAVKITCSVLPAAHEEKIHPF